MSLTTTSAHHPTPQLVPPPVDPGRVGSMTGQVKWFNSKKNYGFIICLSTGTEYFTHLDDIWPRWAGFAGHYKTLYSGEYVTFNVAPSDDGTKSKAVDVRGIAGGPLLCDFGKLRFSAYTRHQFSKADSDELGDMTALGGDAELPVTA